MTSPHGTKPNNMTHQDPSSEPESSANKEASGDRRLSTCSRFLAAAEEIERVAPVTSEDLMLMAEALPPLEGTEAKIALTVIAALMSLHGRVRREYALGVAAGVKRCGGAAALLEACRGNWRAGNMAEKSKGIERVFGAKYSQIGCYLAGSNVLDEADRILANR